MLKRRLLSIAFCFSLLFTSPIMSSGLESLPVLYNGRLQPFDSVARHVLISIQEKTRVTRLVDTKKEHISPSKWLWATITSQKEPLNDKVFLIRDPDTGEEFWIEEV